MIRLSKDELLEHIKANVLAPLPERLYKFRSIDGVALPSILRSQTIRFSNPFNWNDPFDGQIRIDTKNTQSEVARFLKYHQPKLSRAHARETGKKVTKNPKLWEQFVNDKMRERMAEQGFCCFTSDWSPILQWSYYADGHKGVALGFAPYEDLDLFGLPIKVRYLEEYPLVNYVNHSVECLTTLLTVKAKVWEHEQEIRIWNKRGDQPFNPKALADITFGVRCTDEEIGQIINICKASNLNHIQFFRATRSIRKFSLERQLIE